MNDGIAKENLLIGPSSNSPKIKEQHEKLKAKFAMAFIDSVPNAAFILNSNREIVLYNKALVDIVSDTLKNRILGCRPGELLHCGNAQTSRCGESPSCPQCGAQLALITAFSGEVGTEECMLLSDSNGMIVSYTLKVTAAPFVLDDDFFCIVHLVDISDRKNKEVVEKIFLHDLMNAVNGISGAGSLLKEDAVKESTRELAGMVVDRASFMANEINAHRLFISAENNHLEIQHDKISTVKTVKALCALFSSSPLATNRNISITQQVDDFILITDKRLLYRILENLIKNALEASPTNGTVTVKVKKDSQNATFTINNTGYIPRTVAQQIFKRSFSTKGKGRGLGTYSVKMFVKNHLHGKVWFDSSDEDGTNFYVSLPLIPQDAASVL